MTKNYYELPLDKLELAYLDEMDLVICPICKGIGNFLGMLGLRLHFRCRNCGMEFSKKEVKNEHKN